ncbi:MAG: ATP-binding cassette domain-containing protein [Candidatus Aminicenantes bacterium]|nr:ATP-binding cassette domain-containing protein [Candidatus Aminicenantes bacterium]
METVKITNLSKKFRRYHQKSSNIKYAVLNLFKGFGSSRHEDFYALKHINLSVQQGETVGIIGENGSGKSTLLKLIARILFPDEGTIETKGKIATLIELGAGFHDELSGRENIYVNASLLGFKKKEIDDKIDEIIEFSGLKHFIDNPIKTYSSGMYLRLGFSIAINVNPDILLIDEILAVGDENFQKKCFERIEEFKDKGKTILIVSHDLNVIERMCDRVILIDNGQQFSKQDPVEAISEYHKRLFQKRKQALRLGPDKTAVETSGEMRTLTATQFNRWGSREAEITSVKFFDDQGNETYDFRTRDHLKIRMDYHAKKLIKKPVFGIAVYTEDGVLLTGPNTRTGDCDIDVIQGQGSVEYVMESVPFLPASYLFTVSIYDHSLRHAYDHLEKCLVFNVVESRKVKDKFGTLHIPAQWRHVKKGKPEPR